jgi:hypothetical protein
MKPAQDLAREWITNSAGNSYQLIDSLTVLLKSVVANALEEAALEIDQCNHEGPYNAIQGAGRIRALKDRVK